ncbi:unnamed protein product [Phaeothamnion confervicola]
MPRGPAAFRNSLPLRSAAAMVAGAAAAELTAATGRRTHSRTGSLPITLTQLYLSGGSGGGSSDGALSEGASPVAHGASSMTRPAAWGLSRLHIISPSGEPSFPGGSDGSADGNRPLSTSSAPGYASGPMLGCSPAADRGGGGGSSVGTGGTGTGGGCSGGDGVWYMGEDANAVLLRRLTPSHSFDIGKSRTPRSRGAALERFQHSLVKEMADSHGSLSPDTIQLLVDNRAAPLPAAISDATEITIEVESSPLSAMGSAHSVESADSNMGGGGGGGFGRGRGFSLGFRHSTPGGGAGGGGGGGGGSTSYTARNASRAYGGGSYGGAAYGGVLYDDDGSGSKGGGGGGGRSSGNGGGGGGKRSSAGRGEDEQGTTTIHLTGSDPNLLSRFASGGSLSASRSSSRSSINSNGSESSLLGHAGTWLASTTSCWCPQCSHATIRATSASAP